MSYAHLQAAWSEWLIEALCASGVRRAVVSPGSRSTPLVLAISRFEAKGRLEASVVADERVAGFVALGQAKLTGAPTLLVCTSGTAGAHYFPAVIEASQSGTPLIVLTADRPPELQARGANQTIDQSNLFGRYVRQSLDLGIPDPDPRACEGLIRTAARAVQASLAPESGPVHLNARFRQPLQVETADPPEVSDLRSRIEGVFEGGLPRPRSLRLAPEPHDLDELARRIRRVRRGVVLAGPASVSSPVSYSALERFLELSGFVLLPEATSQLRFGTPGRLVCDAFEPLFGARPGHRPLEPDFVLQIGGAPTGRGLSRWLGSDSAPERVVMSRSGYPEAFNRASDVWLTDPVLVLTGLAARLEGIGPEADWAGRAVSECDRIWEALAGLLADADGFPEPAAVRTAVDAVPSGGLLALGNSLPVREVDLFCPSTSRSIAVLSQRGASGIDGGISAAAGAVAASGFPTVLLLGDVSFQHDIGGLAAARDLPASLAIVVLRNGGGRLFDLLPVRDLPGDAAKSFERFFLTPPAIEPAGAAAAFSIPSIVAGSAEELSDAIADAASRPGATVVEARVDGDSSANWIRTLIEVAERIF
ncbi:MAG: 2-succinyl-5-enolpyruvyl-6-hydroxy-3-cyclohexene-1-carboxylic-acid synthase [Gemmatimonadetes bacterium]|nr:2-succinyl-5-enolpyruvyl-6-hydroxy-3-cyclohexene-1-carboxylic-acid synthase [Gemmatimonadota bacterium]